MEIVGGLQYFDRLHTYCMNSEHFARNHLLYIQDLIQESAYPLVLKSLYTSVALLQPFSTTVLWHTCVL